MTDLEIEVLSPDAQGRPVFMLWLGQASYRMTGPELTELRYRINQPCVKRGLRSRGVMTESTEPMPQAPDGYSACRTMTGPNQQVSHLVVRGPGRSAGSPGSTLCGLRRFDRRDDDGRRIEGTADIGGWSINGGVSGPGVEQVKCPSCWADPVGRSLDLLTFWLVDTHRDTYPVCDRAVQGHVAVLLHELSRLRASDG